MISSVRFAIKNWPPVPYEGSLFLVVSLAGNKPNSGQPVTFVGGFLWLFFTKFEQNSFQRESLDATLVCKWVLSLQSARNKHDDDEENSQKSHYSSSSIPNTH